MRGFLIPSLSSDIDMDARVTERAMLAKRGVALLPVGLCLAYIFGLRQGKPPGYDRDIFERVFTGGGFAPEPPRLTHPLAKDQL